MFHKVYMNNVMSFCGHREKSPDRGSVWFCWLERQKSGFCHFEWFLAFVDWNTINNVSVKGTGPFKVQLTHWWCRLDSPSVQQKIPKTENNYWLKLLLLLITKVFSSRTCLNIITMQTTTVLGLTRVSGAVIMGEEDSLQCAGTCMGGCRSSSAAWWCSSGPLLLLCPAENVNIKAIKPANAFFFFFFFFGPVEGSRNKLWT